jgi:hypothetical protein
VIVVAARHWLSSKWRRVEMEGHLGLLKNLKGVEGKSEALKSKVRRSMKAGAESGAQAGMGWRHGSRS